MDGRSLPWEEEQPRPVKVEQTSTKRCQPDTQRFVLPPRFQNRDEEGLVEFHLRRCALGFALQPINLSLELFCWNKTHLPN